MSCSLKQTRRFARTTKKLHDNIVADNPVIEEQKKGDLSDLFVYKFRSQNQLYLLGYTLDEEVKLVYLATVGPHENFYRDLKYS
ncbi:MAG: type II toxin-antitoxin system RelE/ParE family toxin [Gallionellaceae bacterium]